MSYDALLSPVPADCLQAIRALLPDPDATVDLLCMVEADAGPAIGRARVYFQRTRHGWGCYRIEPIAGPIYDVPF